jgi:hypothetical protein
MRGSVSAELLLLRKRRSTWILLGIWTALATFFSYLLPYVEYRNGDLGGGPGETPLEDLLPGELAGHLSGGSPSSAASSRSCWACSRSGANTAGER